VVGLAALTQGRSDVDDVCSKLENSECHCLEAGPVLEEWGTGFIKGWGWERRLVTGRLHCLICTAHCTLHSAVCCQAQHKLLLLLCLCHSRCRSAGCANLLLYALVPATDPVLTATLPCAHFLLPNSPQHLHQGCRFCPVRWRW
jgi:hypothetical protein